MNFAEHMRSGPLEILASYCDPIDLWFLRQVCTAWMGRKGPLMAIRAKMAIVYGTKKMKTWTLEDPRMILLGTSVGIPRYMLEMDRTYIDPFQKVENINGNLALIVNKISPLAIKNMLGDPISFSTAINVLIGFTASDDAKKILADWCRYMIVSEDLCGNRGPLLEFVRLSEARFEKRARTAGKEMSEVLKMVEGTDEWYCRLPAEYRQFGDHDSYCSPFLTQRSRTEQSIWNCRPVMSTRSTCTVNGVVQFID